MRAVLRRWRAAIPALCLLVALAATALSRSVAAAPAVTFTGNSSVSGHWDGQISLGTLQLTGSGNPTVSVELSVPEGTIDMTTTTGLTITLQDDDQLKFSGTMNNVNAALATLYFEAESRKSVVLEASVTGANEVYWPENGHIYEYVPVSGNINWVNANTAAQARTNGGLNGYLATITSEAENTFVAARLTGAGWMGASDAATEGVWQWVSGPEAGTTFWNGTYTGSVVPGQYENWNENEPNNSGNEDCAQYLIGAGDEGQWNDLPCSTSMIAGYVVEYGDDDTVPEVATKSLNINVSYDVYEVDTCEDLQDYVTGAGRRMDTLVQTGDIDCEGVDFEPLFHDTPFRGIYDGQGYKISNITIDEAGDNVGLFSRTIGADIHDVELFGSVSGDDNVGGLIGSAQETSVAAVISHLDVTATGSVVGGLVGEYLVDQSDPDFYDSSSSGQVTGDWTVGGLIGNVAVTAPGELTMFKVFATGNVNAYAVGGGLFGYVDVRSSAAEEINVSIQDAYATGNVTTDYYAGGLFGKLDVSNNNGTNPITFNLLRTYATGDVSTNEYGGGLIGDYFGPTKNLIYVNILHNFAAGEVVSQDPDLGGGFIGSYTEDKSITSENNYFDAARSGQEECNGGDPFPGTCAGIDDSQPDYFFNNTTNPPLDEWFFGEIWVMHRYTYPTFAEIHEEDLNGDNLDDAGQDNISGYINSRTGKYVVIDVGAGCEITTDDLAAEANLAVQDPGYDYANDLFDFEADCGTPGFTTTIKLYYYDVSKAGLVLRKFNPNTNTFFNLTGAPHDATLEERTIDGHTVTVATYQITDGGVLDMDGAVNGELADPVGLAAAVSAAGSQGGALADTGANELMTAAVAVGLIFAGGVLGLINRRLKVPTHRHF